MLTWSHFTFRQHLIHKAREYGVNVYLCHEDYTSKTCTKCREINNVGGKEYFTCVSCGLSIDRDVNGARNILLCALGDAPLDQ